MWRKIYQGVATAGGIGRLPLAPGTWAALAAAIVWYILKTRTSFIAGSERELIIVVLLVITGIIVSGFAERDWGKDPGKVVIDEVAGMCISILWIAPVIRYYVAGFILFRLFDIFKPFGIRSLEKTGGGYGIMLDDVLAGIYSLLTLKLIIMTGLF